MNLIIQILLGFLLARMIVNVMNAKRQRDQVLALQGKYLDMDVNELASLSDTEIIEGASYKVANRYTQLHGGLGVLKESEKILLAYDQMKICCTTPRMSIGNFFTDYTSLMIHTNQLFDVIKEGKEVYEGAYQLYLQYEEEYKRDIDEVLAEYDEESETETNEKTYEDYSREMGAILIKSEVVTLMAQYVREHVSDYVYEIEEDEDDDTEVSNFLDED